jgi:multisubunit Na+/H+ antiporter MnhF subunit
MQASTAATLLGLVFVAASINLARIVSTPTLPGRVLESVVQFVQVLFISMLMTIPQQSSTTLAIEVLTVLFLSWALQMLAFARYHRAHLGNPRWWLVMRMALAHLAIVPFFVFAGCLFFRIENALYWAVPGFFFSFLAGLVNSWVLLIQVGRRVNFPATRPEPGSVRSH